MLTDVDPTVEYHLLGSCLFSFQEKSFRDQHSQALRTFLLQDVYSIIKL